jgi:hypothetical protein
MVLPNLYNTHSFNRNQFISNPTEGAYLDSEEGQTNLPKLVPVQYKSYKKENFLMENEAPTEKPSDEVKIFQQKLLIHQKNQIQWQEKRKDKI